MTTPSLLALTSSKRLRRGRPTYLVGYPRNLISKQTNARQLGRDSLDCENAFRNDVALKYLIPGGKIDRKRLIWVNIEIYDVGDVCHESIVRQYTAVKGCRKYGNRNIYIRIEGWISFNLAKLGRCTGKLLYRGPAFAKPFACFVVMYCVFVARIESKFYHNSAIFEMRFVVYSNMHCISRALLGNFNDACAAIVANKQVINEFGQGSENSFKVRKALGSHLSLSQDYLLISSLHLPADPHASIPGRSNCSCRTYQCLISIKPELEAPGSFVDLGRFGDFFIPTNGFHAGFDCDAYQDQQRYADPWCPAPQFALTHQAFEHAEPFRSKIESVAARRTVRIVPLAEAAE